MVGSLMKSNLREADSLCEQAMDNEIVTASRPTVMACYITNCLSFLLLFIISWPYKYKTKI